MLKMLKGLYAVLITPFEANGEIDEASIDRLVEFYLEKKVHGLVTLSVMGEGPLLLEEERIQVAERVLSRVNDRVPVVVGINRDEATVAAKFAQRVVNLGASALLVAPPPLPSPNLDAIIEYYQAIARATRVPIVVLDYPPITGKMPVSFLKRLVEEIEEVCAVKLEELPTCLKMAQLRAAVGQRIRIFGGLGGVYCLQELECGSDGLMTGYAYPEHLLEILNKFWAGDVSGATEEYARWLPLLTYERKLGLALRKEILKQRRAIAIAGVRSPAARIDNRIRAELERILNKLGAENLFTGA